MENFYELPQQDVLAMRYQGQEVLVPVVDEIVVSHADMDAKPGFRQSARRACWTFI
ncbi:MAG: hypothetical protein WKG07_04305 [Hymenobacter sp.]